MEVMDEKDKLLYSWSYADDNTPIKSKAVELKDLIKDNMVKFNSFRAGIFYYDIFKPAGDGFIFELYQFTIPIEDIGGATILAQDKAITYMRWIRKAISDGTLMKIK